MNIHEKMKSVRLIPVVVLTDIEDTLPTLEGLYRGGLPLAEITFRTACAVDAIKLAKQKMPDMTVGAGTIINGEQAKTAIGCGAEFIIGPGFSDEVADVCEAEKVTYIPGCVTPTEIIRAVSREIKVVKFFPAENYGGVKTLKSLSSVFPGVSFMPTGGINSENIGTYLEKSFVIACGGSFMMKKSPTETEAATKEAMRLINSLRGKAWLNT